VVTAPPTIIAQRNKRSSDFLHPRNERISSEVGTSKEKGRGSRR
jgi:hypothetical protein